MPYNFAEAAVYACSNIFENLRKKDVKMSWLSFVAEACLTGLVVDACVCLSALTENQPARLDSDLV